MKRILMLSVVCFSFTSDAMRANPQELQEAQQEVAPPPRYTYIQGITTDGLANINQQVADIHAGLTSKQKIALSMNAIRREFPSDSRSYVFWRFIDGISDPAEKFFYMFGGVVLPVFSACISDYGVARALSIAIVFCTAISMIFSNTGGYSSKKMIELNRNELYIGALRNEISPRLLRDLLGDNHEFAAHQLPIGGVEDQIEERLLDGREPDGDMA
jgi:hypothetical protein